MFLIFRLEGLPRSVPIINWFVLMAMLGGPRFVYRLIKDRRFDWTLHADADAKVPVLLVGAGDEAELFIRASTRSQGATYRPIGAVAESSGRVGRNIHGVPVLGTVNEINNVVNALDDVDRPQRMVLTKDTIKGTEVRELLDTAQA